MSGQDAEEAKIADAMELYNLLQMACAGLEPDVALCAHGESLGAIIAFASNTLADADATIDKCPQQLRRVVRERWGESRTARAAAVHVSSPAAGRPN
jgi:hypothetical protein